MLIQYIENVDGKSNYKQIQKNIHLVFHFIGLILNNMVFKQIENRVTILKKYLFKILRSILLCDV